MSQEDEQPPSHRRDGSRPASASDNSLGRLLTLSDGIFAIAMTLLALDLKVPDVGAHPSDASLRHALAANADSYWSFLLTFWVIAGYWLRHRRLMRSVVRSHDTLIRDTVILLLLVAAMPFPASLLGRYGSEPISLAIYGGVNALATLCLTVMSADVRRLGLADSRLSATDDYAHLWTRWYTLAVFVVCIPGGYVLHRRGPYLLLLLLVPDVLSRIRWVAQHVRRSPAAS
jgi:uncharacterized membrane protein